MFSNNAPTGDAMSSDFTPATVMMTREEARTLTDSARNSLSNAKAALVEIYDREGWRALGYDSWRSWATTEFPEWSQATLYRKLGEAKSFSQGEKTQPAVQQLVAPMKSGRPLGAKGKAAPRQAQLAEPLRGALAVPAEAVPDARTQCDKCNGTGWITPSKKVPEKPLPKSAFPTLAPKGQVTAFWDLVQEVSDRQRLYECAKCGHRYRTTKNGLGWPALPAYCPGKCKSG